jgi:hypothetical protein
MYLHITQSGFDLTTQTPQAEMVAVDARVARFFLVQRAKTEDMYQITT